MKQQSRRQSRETAFCLIFEWSFHQEGLESMLKNAMDGRSEEPDDFARELVRKTIAAVEELDALIEHYSETWKVTRLSRVTLAVLRLGFCEITRMDDIPLGATINEAVELCKKYATEDEAAYVNGMLGRYGRELAAGAGGIPSDFELPEGEFDPAEVFDLFKESDPADVFELAPDADPAQEAGSPEAAELPVEQD